MYTMMSAQGVRSGMQLAYMAAITVTCVAMKIAGRAFVKEGVVVTTRTHARISDHLAQEISTFVHSLTAGEQRELFNGVNTCEADHVKTWAKDLRNFVVVARAATGEIVGYARVGWGEDRQVGDISVAVHEDFRVGFGRLLIMETLILMWLFGVRRANAQINRHNVPSKKSFAWCGFAPSSNNPCDEELNYELVLH